MFNTALHDARENAHMSRATLAGLINYSANLISKIEEGVVDPSRSFYDAVVVVFPGVHAGNPRPAAVPLQVYPPHPRAVAAIERMLKLHQYIVRMNLGPRRRALLMSFALFLLDGDYTEDEIRTALDVI